MNEPLPAQSGNEAERRLLQSALELFAEKGYDGTSIREIIAGAGVTRPVLYYYFKNKEDLFRRLVEPIFNEFLEAVSRLRFQYADTLGRLKAVMRLTFSLAEQNPQAIRLIFQMYFTPPASAPRLDKLDFRRKRFQRLLEIIQEGLDRAELAGGDAQSLTLAFIGLMDTHIMAKTHIRGMILTDELADALVDLFYYGACYKEVSPFHLTTQFRYV
ncbi:MAG TPA: TetR/AcrR family transcriptional regulator [Candidatus Hydrogenedentes bacterium]|nr:TetR/AcrR family transcriptional regulator [Candidatus Hydrogenedentota bacterium]